MEGGYKFISQQFEYQPKKKPPAEKKPAVFTEKRLSKKKREEKIEEITKEINDQLSGN